MDTDDTTDNTNITFTGEYQFSIRCGKCADIHNAQLEGKNTEPCTCDCHANVTPPYQPYVPYYPPCPCPTYPYPYYYTTTTETLGGIKTQPCSIHDEYSPTTGGCTCI